MSAASPADILSFWQDAGPDKWFKHNDTFDGTIRSRFLTTYEAAAGGELGAFEQSVEGALALVILLDQFPRNMFRGDARAFATDVPARAVADRAISRGFDQMTVPALRMFFYLPFMHSEAVTDQNRCVQLFAALGDTEQSRYAELHRDIVTKFGRFPHRNRMLGRIPTPAEEEFLDGGGFAG